MKRYNISYADWTSREFGAIVRCLLTGRVHQGPDIARLQERLNAMYAPSSVHLLNYAHHGIARALAWCARRRPDRQEVIVPAYICPSVPQTVRAAGLKVRCVPVGDDLNLTVDGVRGALGSATLAVIAPHMYGCPAPIEALEDLCRAAGIFLVDDAAQVVGERVSGRLLGTFGDVGVISFAQSKAIVTGIRGSGGVLLINRPEWSAEAADACADLPTARRRLGAMVDFFWNYTGSAYTRQTGYYLKKVWQQLCRFRAEMPCGPTCISNVDAAVALAQLDRLEWMRCARLRLLRSYHDALATSEGLIFPQYKPDRYLARVVVRLPKGVNVDRVRRQLITNGVESRAPYPLIPEDSTSVDQTTCFTQGLIGLPTSSMLQTSDVVAICTVVREAVRLAGSG